SPRLPAAIVDRDRAAVAVSVWVGSARVRLRAQRRGTLRALLDDQRERVPRVRVELLEREADPEALDSAAFGALDVDHVTRHGEERHVLARTEHLGNHHLDAFAAIGAV